MTFMKFLYRRKVLVSYNVLSMFVYCKSAKIFSSYNINGTKCRFEIVKSTLYSMKYIDLWLDIDIDSTIQCCYNVFGKLSPDKFNVRLKFYVVHFYSCQLRDFKNSWNRPWLPLNFMTSQYRKQAACLGFCKKAVSTEKCLWPVLSGVCR